MGFPVEQVVFAKLFMEYDYNDMLNKGEKICTHDLLTMIHS